MRIVYNHSFIKSMIVRWANRIARMRNVVNGDRVLGRKPEVRRPLGSSVGVRKMALMVSVKLK